ncbi:unnamed protein product [Hyaloperonospora brassicae]|uniref:RxLR effector protein n=1 Tax=Hyaloperonospora brassicae TaxID=162125 RepID=A0AAV0TEE8_HYABA|nr:unnamed protein product [Hyaloperonospora brassicae]
MKLIHSVALVMHVSIILAGLASASDTPLNAPSKINTALSNEGQRRLRLETVAGEARGFGELEKLETVVEETAPNFRKYVHKLNEPDDDTTGVAVVRTDLQGQIN